MNSYAIYYDYNENKNDLIILFKNKEYTKVENYHNVDVYLRDNEVVKYVIHGINNLIKIYSKGIIHSPLKELIDVINIFLSKANLKSLTYKENSGFIIGQIVENGRVDLGNKIISIDTPDDLLNQFVVVSIPNIFIKKDKFLTDYHLCTFLDLGISDEDKIFVIDEKCEKGKDFYLWESK